MAARLFLSSLEIEALDLCEVIYTDEQLCASLCPSLLCSMLPTALTTTLVNLFSFWGLWGLYQPTTTPKPTHQNHVKEMQTHLSFELRHLHAVSPAARVVLADVQSNAAHLHSNNHAHDQKSYEVQTRPLTSFRPTSFDAYSQARLHSIRRDQSHALQWEEDEIVGPNVESRETLLTLAKMTNNAYIEPEDAQWYDLGGNWNDVRMHTSVYIIDISIGLFF